VRGEAWFLLGKESWWIQREAPAALSAVYEGVGDDARTSARFDRDIAVMLGLARAGE
jgi:hypothetical protein